MHAVPRTITHGDTALYQALVGSRNSLHCSEPFAQSIGYRTAPVDDLLVFHIAFGKTVPDISYNAVANLGYADCRFVQPVYVGDTLRAETEIVGLKANSNGKTGVVYVRSNCFNQRDELVLSWVRWVMVHRRRAVDNADTLADGVTQFASEVDATRINASSIGSTIGIEAAHPGAAYWDDVSDANGDDATLALGKPILHPAGMTLDETDHTLATKLYQNTARVHFDFHHMKDSRFGRRLIYGGQIISICRALSFDGLENALCIAAINSGAHENPSFAGDTIYAVTRPIAKWPVSRHVGALRVVLQGYKNLDPNSADFANHSLTSASDADRVLSLDLTYLMPRRP
jgi:2-methylfumaryl-CoA hydratase